MDKTKSKKILIIGQGAVPVALAKKLAQNKDIGEIFIAPSNNIDSELYKSVDLRENDITGLLKFALENEIDLTIPTSENCIKSDIVSFFQENGQNIFGPTKEAAKIAYNKSFGKKFLYKIRAITAKFGVFDKMQPAEDWLKKANFPVVIRTCENNALGDRLMCPTISLAYEFLNNLFTKNETDILIEEYTYGHNFTIYFITDGYSAIPFATVGNYKFTQDGDGGLLTDGTGCYAPDYKISETVLQRLNKTINNALNALDKKNSPYLGILGADCTLTQGDDTFVINEFKPFIQNVDASAILRLTDDNLIEIFQACIDGIFADEYEQIKTNNLSSVATMVTARQHNKIIKGLDKIDDISNIDFINIHKNGENYTTNKGEAFVLTRSASTITRAKEYLYEDLSEIKFDGMKFRNDICK